MGNLPGPAGEWLGFSRRERRSSLILLIIIAVVFLLRYAFPSDRLAVEELEIAGSFIAGERSGMRQLPGPDGGPATGSPESARALNPVATGRAKYQDGRKKIELNSADSSALESLPLIGPVLAARTVRYRELLGGFYSVQQLTEVYGLSEETFNVIRDMVTADTSAVRKIDINSATYGQLLRHPYIERADVLAILKYRELSGSLGSVADLSVHRLVDSSRLKRLGPYLLFNR
ncbi:MAG: helix-hairpin-helix domain-containing protein [Bacteroidales bacterium]|jgi:DNA uptake protein ComE-like DNA-binding protein|nr:helix-hairpin-helix domain-containing protein [Bacteroidales bacterium]